MSTENVRIAVIGAGAWGINHVRAWARTKGAELVLVCDAAESARKRAAQIAPRARLGESLAAALEASDVDAVVLATPAVRHAEQALSAFAAGKHVFVEKPMALSTPDARAMVEAAEAAGKTLMVGHLMIYHPAVTRLHSMIAAGDLGKLLYMYALRVNLGRVRQDENAMWSLAPHDISMILHLLGEAPVSVSARGGSYLQPGIEDVAFMNLRFQTGVVAQIQLSWLDPRKARKLTIVGSRRMVEFDDVEANEKLRVYDKGFDRPPEFTEFSEFLSIRNGDIHIPQIPSSEPLDAECKHFIDCIATGKTPITDGRSGLHVVEVLNAAQRSMERDGEPVLLSTL